MSRPGAGARVSFTPRARGYEPSRAFAFEGVEAFEEVEAVSASVADEQLITYLTHAHAIEEQSLALLRRMRRSWGRGELQALGEQQLARAERDRGLLEDRLEAHGARSSALEDAAMRLGALNVSLVFEAHPETPGKATAFAFALTHLKIAGYELLKRVAARAEDELTVAMADRVLADERAGAVSLSASFDGAVDASQQGRDAPRKPVEQLLRTLSPGAREGTRLRPV